MAKISYQIGNKTGVAVPVGGIGQVQESVGSATTPTTGQYNDGGNAGIPVTPGVYMMTAHLTYAPGSGTLITSMLCGIGTVSGNSGVGLVINNYTYLRPAAHTPSGTHVIHSPTWFVVVTANTTYYPKSRIAGTIGTGTVTNDLTVVRIA